jgi:hypothetical protein
MGLVGLVPMGDAGAAFDVDADVDFHDPDPPRPP